MIFMKALRIFLFYAFNEFQVQLHFLPQRGTTNPMISYFKVR